MAPPRKHETDAILDATRALVLTEGPRAASVAAIAIASGAPAGTLYHRFGNRDGILTAAWLRALARFQGRVMLAGDSHRSGPGENDAAEALETAVAMAVAAVDFAGEVPQDARLLLTIRLGDLLDAQPGDAFAETLAAMNTPLRERVTELSRQLYGGDDARSLDAVRRAVVDMPYAVVRRHAHDNPLPTWLAGDVAVGVRALLASHSPARRSGRG
jgi:AcrR family transcriptional regulator